MSMSSDTTRNVVDGAELYFPGEELTNSDPRIEMATLFLNIIYPKRVEELDKEVDVCNDMYVPYHCFREK